MTNKTNPIVLVAGGTGGHVMPAAALACDLIARGLDVHLITDKRGLAYSKSFDKSVTISKVCASAPTGGIFKKAKAAAVLGFGMLQSIKLLRSIKPSVVVGFGGYPSLPSVLAAGQLGIPIVLHEQNATFGKANEFLAPKAKRIALSWPISQDLKKEQSVRCVITGNPVRADIAALCSKPYRAPEADGELRVFVLGGSLGAKVFSDVIPKALTSLSDEEKPRINVIQHCLEGDINSVRSTYEDSGIKATLATFFDDVAEQLENAHLIIARAGASMVAETTASGRPAIFVPYPHHSDQQQSLNAQAVEDAGGAWIMPQDGFTPDALSARIETFLQSPEILFDAANKAHECGKPNAARKLGNLVTAIAKGW